MTEPKTTLPPADILEGPDFAGVGLPPECTDSDCECSSDPESDKLVQMMRDIGAGRRPQQMLVDIDGLAGLNMDGFPPPNLESSHLDPKIDPSEDWQVLTFDPKDPNSPLVLLPKPIREPAAGIEGNGSIPVSDPLLD